MTVDFMLKGEKLDYFEQRFNESNFDFYERVNRRQVNISIKHNGHCELEFSPDQFN